MTTIEIMLPDELAERARNAGLLSDSFWRTRYAAAPGARCWTWRNACKPLRFRQ
jgi:hypothetical protein